MHVGLDLFNIGLQGRLHHNLQQFLGLAVQGALPGVGGLDKCAVGFRPFQVGLGHDAVHLQGVAPVLGLGIEKCLGFVGGHGLLLVYDLNIDGQDGQDEDLLQTVMSPGCRLLRVVLLEQVRVFASVQGQVVGEQLQRHYTGQGAPQFRQGFHGKAG